MTDAAGDPLAYEIRTLQSDLQTRASQRSCAQMLPDHLWTRLAAANARETEAWNALASTEEREAFFQERLRALRYSLGGPVEDRAVEDQVTGRYEGEGFCVENLVFESRPGLQVTANLYLPHPLVERMPGILLCHSHHRPKTQGELQDMGRCWARTGAMVLVMDHLGHGERGQQPFGGREDYYSRGLLGMQLHLVGESLMGWMVHDLRCGVSLLLSRRDIDPGRIIVVGSVAGGGDPAAVTAALDPRITCAIPFNYGGPQPETPYPLPEDAEKTFNYAGIPELESTRCLRLSARDGFTPWVVVASIAPRYLICGHEFSWDQARDPVWKRLTDTFDQYHAGERLAFAHGWGVLAQRPPEASHCGNVGRPHREMIYPTLQRWFGMPAPDDREEDRLPECTLRCFPDEGRPAGGKKVQELALTLAQERLRVARQARRAYDRVGRSERLRHELVAVLGPSCPEDTVPVVDIQDLACQGFRAERVVLESEPGIGVPLVLLVPRPTYLGNDPPGSARGAGPYPVVLGVAQEGKARFLKEHEDAVSALLRSGIAVCLADVRGTGETETDDARGLSSVPLEATKISPGELMLGYTLLGQRMLDLRAVIRFLRARDSLDASRLVLWGDGFAPANSPCVDDPPAASPDKPYRSEPLGALLALLGGLYEEGIRAVVAGHGLVSFEQALSTPAMYLPHDVIVPGLLTVADVDDLAAALSPCPLWLYSLVNGRNQQLDLAQAEPWLALTREAYRDAPENLRLQPTKEGELARWLAVCLGR